MYIWREEVINLRLLGQEMIRDQHKLLFGRDLELEIEDIRRKLLEREYPHEGLYTMDDNGKFTFLREGFRIPVQK